MKSRSSSFIPQIGMGSAISKPSDPVNQRDWDKGKRLLFKHIWGYIKTSAIAAALIVVTSPLYNRLVLKWRQRGLSETSFYVAISAAVHTIMYILCCGGFTILDKFKLLQQYKLPRKPIQQPTDKMMKKTVGEAMLAQLVTQPLTLYFLWPFAKKLGVKAFAPPPGFLPNFWRFIVSLITLDVGFYFAHRWLHSPWLYARVHKQHHQYTGTVSVAAEHAHWFEQIVANQLPTAAGPLLTGGHLYFNIIWLIWRLEETYEAHSGYSFKGTWLDKLGLLHADGAVFHDFHHTGNRGNYGSEFLDWVCGTLDPSWSQFVADKNEQLNNNNSNKGNKAIQPDQLRAIEQGKKQTNGVAAH